jgi:hypothetical protein
MRGACFGVCLFVAMMGCGNGPVRAPRVGFRSLRSADPILFDQAMLAATVAGHVPTQIDAQHGRFVVLATSDPHHEIRFVVQCHADGWITLTPIGAGIVLEAGRYALPHLVRDEYASFALSMESTLVVVSR